MKKVELLVYFNLSQIHFLSALFSAQVVSANITFDPAKAHSALESAAECVETLFATSKLPSDGKSNFVIVIEGFHILVIAESNADTQAYIDACVCSFANKYPKLLFKNGVSYLREHKSRTTQNTPNGYPPYMYAHGAAFPLPLIFLNNKAGCISEGRTTDVANEVLGGPRINIRVEGKNLRNNPSYVNNWTYSPNDVGSAYLNIVQPAIATVGNVDRYHIVNQAVKDRYAAIKRGTFNVNVILLTRIQLTSFTT